MSCKLLVPLCTFFVRHAESGLCSLHKQTFCRMKSVCFVCQGLRSRRWESWEAPGPLQALVRRVYVSMVGQRRDQTLVALGRCGTGKTTTCQSFSQELLKQAGTAGGSLTCEWIHCSVYNLKLQYRTGIEYILKLTNRNESNKSLNNLYGLCWIWFLKEPLVEFTSSSLVITTAQCDMFHSTEYQHLCVCESPDDKWLLKCYSSSLEAVESCLCVVTCKVVLVCV